MTTVNAITNIVETSKTKDAVAAILKNSLTQWFAIEFRIFDSTSQEYLTEQPSHYKLDWDLLEPLATEVGQRQAPQFIAEAEHVMVLAIPMNSTADESLIAIGAFVINGSKPSDLTEVAKLLCCDQAMVTQWTEQQPTWQAEALLRTANLAQQQFKSQQEIESLKSEADHLSENISSTYEEISLLYRVTQNLKLSSSREHIGQLTLQWLSEIVPAKSLAILLCSSDPDETLGSTAKVKPLLLSVGDNPLDEPRLTQLIDHLELRKSTRIAVVNPPISTKPEWPFPEFQQVVIVPISVGEKVFGHFIGLNHQQGLEFGSVEASLFSSVGTILGIHIANLNLYGQQSDLLTGVVQSLTAAIDAKDPYTCGHSDRVARVSVRLAQQLNCSAADISSIYLGGMLHDVGKIGIDDDVLRKPGRLTEAEYEHIKMHPELGYKILCGLKQFEHILPIVLHHHEQWDGKGYPHQLQGDGIPFLARIVAVADSFDAMGSDRPYRQGMADEKLDAILKDGAGGQWDANVIKAFFEARDDVRGIAQSERETLTLDVLQWN